MTGYVYVITNTITGKRYVGQTTLSLERRWRTHLHQANSRVAGTVPVFISAIRKYGPAAFTMSQHLRLSDCTKEQLDAAEADAILLFGTLVPAGYNLRAAGSRGRLHEETKAKISAGNTGKTRSPEARDRYRQARLNETPEARANRTAPLKGRKADPLQIAKMNAARVVNGRRTDLTPELRYRLGSSARGKKRHPATTAAIRAAHVGAKRSPQACANIRAGIAAAAERRRLEGMAI